MKWQPDAALSSALDELIERRRRTFRQQITQQHRAIQLKHSARGTSFSPQVLYDLGQALQETFVEFSDGLIGDLLGTMKGEDGTVSNDAATWMRQRLEPLLVSDLQQAVDDMRSPDRERFIASLHEGAQAMILEARRNLAIAIGRVTERRRASGVRAPAPVDLAFVDDLVALKNRRGFSLDFPTLFNEACTASEPLALVRIDVDDFKAVNDEHGGHAVGDEALAAIGGMLQACVRGKGDAYRVGGDEFVLLLPNHTADEARSVAERVRRTVNARPLTSRSLTLSVSVGVAAYPDHASDAAALEHAADQAGYEAKKSGRNLVRVFGET